MASALCVRRPEVKRTVRHGQNPSSANPLTLEACGSDHCNVCLKGPFWRLSLVGGGGEKHCVHPVCAASPRHAVLAPAEGTLSATCTWEDELYVPCGAHRQRRRRERDWRAPSTGYRSKSCGQVRLLCVRIRPSLGCNARHHWCTSHPHSPITCSSLGSSTAVTPACVDVLLFNGDKLWIVPLTVPGPGGGREPSSPPYCFNLEDAVGSSSATRKERRTRWRVFGRLVASSFSEFWDAQRRFHTSKGKQSVEEKARGAAPSPNPSACQVGMRLTQGW